MQSDLHKLKPEINKMRHWLQSLRNSGKRDKSATNWDEEKPYTLRVKFQWLHVGCIMKENPKWKERKSAPTHQFCPTGSLLYMWDKVAIDKNSK